MHVTLFPQHRDDRIIPRGAVKCDLLVSDVKRIDGTIHLALILPIGPHASELARFLAPIIDPPDGLIKLPPYNAEGQ